MLKNESYSVLDLHFPDRDLYFSNAAAAFFDVSMQSVPVASEQSGDFGFWDFFLQEFFDFCVFAA